MTEFLNFPSQQMKFCKSGTSLGTFKSKAMFRNGCHGAIACPIAMKLVNGGVELNAPKDIGIGFISE